MIYTSYFNNIEKVLAEVTDARLVSIAGKTPDGVDVVKFKALMPHWDWWKEWHGRFADNLESEESIAWYKKKYNSTVLSSLDPLETTRELKDLVGWHTPVLLCYEPPEKFCHRHLVAKWLSNSRIECKEVGEETLHEDKK